MWIELKLVRFAWEAFKNGKRHIPEERLAYISCAQNEWPEELLYLWCLQQNPSS